MKKDIQKTYINMLLNGTISMDAVMDYMIEHVPKKLYRYMGFGQYWRNNLFQGQIHLSKPKDFNDPFDSVPFVDFKEFWNKDGDRIFEQNNGFSLKLSPDLQKEQIFILQKEMIEFTQNEMRVCCFSEQKNSMLMWSHYADSHKGFCIEYDTDRIPNNIKKFFLPVIYQENIHNSTFDFNDTQYNSFNFLFFKSKEWEYEKEWRIAVYQKQIIDELNFLNYISAVTLGIDCGEENKNEIVKWGKQRGITVYEEDINYQNYIIDIKKIV